MKQPQTMKLGATPAKLALVGVLAAVLVLVIVQQLPKSEVSQNQEVSKATTPARQPATKPKQTSAKKQRTTPLWPNNDLIATLAYNPFAKPSWVATPQSSSTDNTTGLLAELQAQGASIVMIGEQKKSASIGDQRLRVGDILDGYQITDITAQGILLNKLNSR